MISRNGRYVLIFNGEIYNHAALRAEIDATGLGPAQWQGHSDTETLLEGIALWGLSATLGRASGMFALALWDRSQRVLHLARDRFGEKPLYYGWSGKHFFFASELKAIRTHPAFDDTIDPSALRTLTARGYIPAPLCIYRNFAKLEPGCILTAHEGVHVESLPRMRAPASTRKIQIEPYWTYRATVSEGLQNSFDNEEDALATLERTLVQSVCEQAVADVPVGTFLSGGIDSSLVVALLQKHSASKIKTFSIGFEQETYNEARHAKAVAAHFGTEHFEQYVTVQETRDVIPLLPAMYDEPFGDSSQIPTYLVSKFARQHVKVALSGDGGDELFGGYNRYLSAAKLWGILARCPAPLRRAAGGAMGAIPPRLWNSAAAAFAGGRADHFGTKVQKGFRTIAEARDLTDIFDGFIDPWSGGETPMHHDQTISEFGSYDLDVGSEAPDVVRMMYCDATAYLPGDILCKVDRAAMAVSLETRVPLLDHRVAAVAARIPLSMKIRDGRGKQVMRQLLYRQAPATLFERPKAGFAVPIGQWLRGPLRDWAEELLSENRMNSQGYFNTAVVRHRWAEHLSGKREDAEALWPILMFQAWLDEQ
jgi:asparagine synthase (glutamine-hydrolysing)